MRWHQARWSLLQSYASIDGKRYVSIKEWLGWVRLEISIVECRPVGYNATEMDPRCVSKQKEVSLLMIPKSRNGRQFPDDIFNSVVLSENCSILIQISLKYVPKGPINNKLAWVRIMHWSRSEDKPLSQPRIAWFGDEYVRHAALMT